jgi:hypothetical protein
MVARNPSPAFASCPTSRRSPSPLSLARSSLTPGPETPLWTCDETIVAKTEAVLDRIVAAATLEARP